MRVAKVALFGFLGATIIIHITPLVRPIIRDFENRYLSEKHHVSLSRKKRVDVWISTCLNEILVIVKIFFSTLVAMRDSSFV
jgi:hypothetical protein